MKTISTEEAKTLFGLFRLRVQYSPDKEAYRYFDTIKKSWASLTWKEAAKIMARWQTALEQENLNRGDRVGIMMQNRYEAIIFNLAALGLGFVTVPMYICDNTENIAHIIKNTGIKFLLIEGETQEKLLEAAKADYQGVRILRYDKIEAWLPEKYNSALREKIFDTNELATIFHTSGTTGLSKGAMFNHRSILFNAEATSKTIEFYDTDLLVGFTGGYVLAMLVDITIAFPRSPEDLREIRPTLIISAARLYEYIYEQIMNEFSEKSPMLRIFKYAVDIGWKRFEYCQGRGKRHIEFLIWPLLDMFIASRVKQRFGGKVRYAFYAGANLSSEILKTFIGMGLSVMNCYGQTEAGPVISVNRSDNNLPSSIGKALECFDIRVENGELLVKGTGLMNGYLNNVSATEIAIDKQGWLHTGDSVRIDSDGHIFLIGRMSDIIVMQNKKSISSAEIESEIKADILFEKAMLIGKGKPFLTALIVLNKKSWKTLAKTLELNPDDPLALKEKSVTETVIERINKTLGNYSDTVRIRRVTLLTESWTVQNGLVTPSAKLKRSKLIAKYAEQIEQMYKV